MIKIKSMEQATALSQWIDTEAGAAQLHIAQTASGRITLTRLNDTGKIETIHAIANDGDVQTREVEE